MKITKLFSVLVLAMAGAANAATVSLVPESAFVDEGDSFDINLVLDAADADGAFSRLLQRHRDDRIRPDAGQLRRFQFQRTSLSRSPIHGRHGLIDGG